MLQAEVFYNNKENNNNYKNDRISFTDGEVYRVSNYREYVEVTIATKEHGRIRTKMNRTSLREGDSVSGSCSGYDYGEYKNCNLSRF